MKKTILFLLLLSGFFVLVMVESPVLTFHIADAVPDGCRALTRTVLQYGLDGGSASVTCIDPDNAVRGLESGKFQLLLIDEACLPENFGHRIPAFADALAAYVHIGKLLDNVSSEKLREVWPARRPHWSDLDPVVGDADIHRYAMFPGRPGGGMIQDFLKIRPPASGVTLLNILSEPLLFVSADGEALALVRFQSEYPADSVKVLAVDGVVPTEKSVRDGSYKLSRRYVWAAPKQMSPETEKFLTYSRGETFHSALKDDFLFFLE
ncbi:MAG: hypothetical protein MJ016_01250 [Victivallaceae bacterium]|nr:hypothetical protein [Victivallaceae bacterium]